MQQLMQLHCDYGKAAQKCLYIQCIGAAGRARLARSTTLLLGWPLT